MAVSQAQIVDLLYKQAFGVTKTDTATNKSPSNESIPSPLLLRGDTLWTQANQIPGVAAATAGIVQAYTGASAVECVADTTTVPIGTVYPTWKTNLTYWIPSEFGSTYTAQVWVDNPGAPNPTSTGTQIFAAGSGGTGQYYYNYQSGVLNFIGETIPAALTSGKVLYIVGYRYVGLTGVTNLPSGASIGNITITDTTISSKAGSNGNITISPDGTGIIKFTADLESTGNVTANYLSGNGSGITGVTASTSDNLSNGNTSVTLLSNGNVTFNMANASNGNVPVPNVVVVSSNGLNVLGNIFATGNITGTNINGNITGNISGNINVSGPNTGVVFNDTGNANSTLGFVFDKTSNTANIANTLNIGNLLTVTGAINAFSTLNLTGNILLGNLFENQIVNVSNSSLEIRGGYNNTAGQLSLFAGATGNSAQITLSAASNSIATNADGFTFTNRANDTTLVVVSTTSIVSTSTTSGVLVATGGMGVSGNIYAGGNVNAPGLVSPALTSSASNLVLTAYTGDNSIVLVPTGNGTVDVSSKRITSLATPNAATDAATKQYVDDVAQGLNIHDSVQAATSNSLANLTSGTITYNNGASGVGANLVLTGSPTLDFTSANVFDGNVTLSATNRVLVKNETNAAYNGIYVVSNSTVLTRAADFNSVPEIEAGDFVFVTGGTTYDNTGWVQTANVVIVGTDPIDWTQFSGAGTYQAGNGLTLTGSVFSVNIDNNTTAIVGGNVVVKAGANLTTPNIGDATGTSLTVTGGVTSNTLTANLTLNVTGNANVGNLGTAGLIIATGNITGGNIITGGVVTATGNVTGGNLVTAGNVQTENIVNITANTSIGMGNGSGIVAIYSAGNATQFAPSGLVTLGGVSQIVGGTFGGSGITLGTSQTDIFQNRGGNVTIQVGTGGTIANTWTFAQNGSFTSPGNITTTANANVGNLNTSGEVVATGNGTFGNISTTGSGGNITGANVVSANTFTATANISAGNISTTGSVTTSKLAIGNTAVTANTVTTSSTGANQTIATYAITGTAVTGVEFLVKGVDAAAPGKYSIATVLAVTDGNIANNNVDYTIYGTVRIGTSTGVLAVNIDSGNLALQVTPSSSNSTVWTTQIRTI